jgi:DNA mismatch repair protein MutS2
MMKRDIIEILELDKIKNEVKKYAATNLGQEIIGGLTPVADYDYVLERLSEVSAGKKIIAEYGIPPFGGTRDLRSILKKVDKGIVLSTSELMDVRSSLGAFKAVKGFFNEVVSNLDPRIIENYLHLVTDEGARIIPLPGIEKELDRCLDEYGDVRDNASKTLAAVRSEIDKIGNQVRDKMDAIIRSSKYQSMLQDTLVTRRGDRYVVPVKSEYRNVFEGIIHDQSASGLTVFMEPIAIVKLNNRLRELKRKEEEEVYKILQQLTYLVQEEVETIRENLKIVSLLDIVFARAEYSRVIGGIAPDINTDGIIKIADGRHPLLKDDAIPINISVGGDFKTLVITGPNTGGKTVSLKTIGLFVLMVQTGFHIPAARGTDISIFQKVFADIGDEQSIEQNLSTFSSHIHRIKSFLEEADHKSLVLMDELGAGTDPREGAALGIAILEELRSRGVVSVATTHYSQLKNYAYSQEGVENASVEFDLETLRPTYRVLMGIPGGSYAFAIAQRLGIPEEIVSKARELISGHELEIESIIEGLNSERKSYLQLKEEYEKKDREVTGLKGKYEEMVSSLKEEKARIFKEARQEAEELISKARKECKGILQDLKNADFTSRPAIDRMGTEINERFKKISGESEENLSGKTAIPTDISVGDTVRLKSTGTRGEVIEIDDDRQEALIRAGVMTVRVSLEELLKAEMPEMHKEKLVRKYRVSKAERVSSSLDLRGERYEVAQSRLDKYLDDVFLAGLKQVEIIHGKGTGALREAVQSVLENHTHVSSYRLGRQEEGGSGVTIVSLN